MPTNESVTVEVLILTDTGPKRLEAGIGAIRKLHRELTGVVLDYERERDVVDLTGGHTTIDARPLGTFKLKG